MIRILNLYLPEMYQMVPKRYVTSITTYRHDLPVEYFSTLKILHMDEFDSDLDFKNANLDELYMPSFGGYLEPLAGMKLKKLQISACENIDALKKMPLEYFDVYDFDSDGDISALKNMPLKKLILGGFDGDLSPITGAPLEYLEMDQFTNSLEPLKDTQLKTLIIPCFQGDTSPVAHCNFERLVVDDTADLSQMSIDSFKNITMHHKIDYFR